MRALWQTSKTNAISNKCRHASCTYYTPEQHRRRRKKARGLPGVWGSPLPYNSDRKSGAVAQPQPPPSSTRAAQTLTSVLHKPKTAVRLQPSMHRGTAAPLDKSLRRNAEVFLCCQRKAACVYWLVCRPVKRYSFLCNRLFREVCETLVT